MDFSIALFVVKNCFSKFQQRTIFYGKIVIMSPPLLLLTEEVPNVIEALLRTLEAKDLKLRRHSERVSKFAVHLAGQMQLSDDERDRLHYGGLLHDIGNLGIPDTILLKPSGLTQMEFEEMKLHPVIGQQIIKPLQNGEALRPMIRSHHEKLDGSGYPDGLTGDEIPTLVRVLSVVDVYDSLRSERAYRKAFDHQAALEILHQEAARGWWDAVVVEGLTSMDVPESEFAPV
jgi:HD-GYP domain-containing protein (c-di-GMP phosphodiesterase class II)